MTAKTKFAKLIEGLVDYDGPQLLLLKSDRNFYMFAVAVVRDGFAEPFFGCEVTEKVYQNYFEETTDLNYVFQRAVGKSYYFFDLAKATDKGLQLTKATTDEGENQKYWPEIGFFARSHTSDFNKVRRGGTTKTFKIDGRWGADDFSHFHGKMYDLYSLFGVIKRLDGAHSNNERAFIRQAIRERFWQGGGSYGGFYGSLYSRNAAVRLAPLEVAKIQYASPGEISLRGNASALTDISDILQIFEAKGDELKGAYLNIYGVLRKEGLLSARPDKQFSAIGVRNVVRRNARDLAASMGIDRIDELYEACENNTLVFSKVVLSIFRRANELYLFHAEGRVQRAD